MAGKINLKVLVLDTDFYALESLNSYLAWDRRTRVVALTQNMDEAVAAIQGLSEAELPDVILLEAEAFASADTLRAAIQQLCRLVPEVMIFCLGHEPDGRRASAAVAAGARGYLLRNDVKAQIASAICYALDHSFIVSRSIQESAATAFDARVFHADVVPGGHDYPNMPERVRQALWLCVIEGMPAQLAADEMGVSPHTVRSYIKEGYRILEAYDDTEYPEEMGPLERAFMRFTALNEREDDVSPYRDITTAAE
jgi:DNA-binding NarL/FixJ family response regulator